MNLSLNVASPDLEAQLFASDADMATRRADYFVRWAHRGIGSARRSSSTAIPALPGSYARVGGETTVLRSNDAALVLARTSRAA